MLSFITEKLTAWEKLKAETRPIFIYGMGDGAEKIMRVFQEKGIPFAGIFASDDFVRGILLQATKCGNFPKLKQP